MWRFEYHIFYEWFCWKNKRWNFETDLWCSFSAGEFETLAGLLTNRTFCAALIQNNDEFIRDIIIHLNKIYDVFKTQNKLKQARAVVFDFYMKITTKDAPVISQHDFSYMTMKFQDDFVDEYFELVNIAIEKRLKRGDQLDLTSLADKVRLIKRELAKTGLIDKNVSIIEYEQGYTLYLNNNFVRASEFFKKV